MGGSDQVSLIQSDSIIGPFLMDADLCLGASVWPQKILVVEVR